MFVEFCGIDVAIGADGVARSVFDDLSERGEFVHVQLAQADGVQAKLVGEVGDAEHFFSGFADISVDEIAVIPEWEFSEDLEGLANLLSVKALVELFEDAVAGGFDTQKQDSKARFVGFFEQCGIFGNFQSGVDGIDFFDPAFEKEVADFFGTRRFDEEIIVGELDHSCRAGGDFIDDRFGRSGFVFAFLA